MRGMLIVTAQAPFPPRNGVTVPAAALTHGLRTRGHRVEVAWLRGPGTDPDGEEETRRHVARVHDLQAVPRSLAARALGELALGRPAFDRWKIGPVDTGAVERPDLIWATPRSCVNPALRLRARAGWSHAPVVAAVNDAWTGVLERRGGGGWAGRTRRTLMARAEGNLLSRPDGVVVQSESDASVLVDRLGVARERVHVLANGADDSLFDLDLDRPRSAIGWVGDARHAHYGGGVRRFLQEVWPEVKARHTDRQIHLFGPGTLQLGTDVDRSVVARGFVPSLRDVYEPLSVLVAPTFKGHGRINKVIEAMASGVAVIGDETAFHGIRGFEPDRHGAVMDGWQDFASVLAGLLDDPARVAELSANARELAESQFRWRDRVDTVERWLVEGL